MTFCAHIAFLAMLKETLKNKPDTALLRVGRSEKYSLARKEHSCQITKTEATKKEKSLNCFNFFFFLHFSKDHILKTKGLQYLRFVQFVFRFLKIF